MTQGFRVALAAVAALFVIGVVVQVFFAGMAVFGAGEWTTHVDFGYGVAALPVVLLLLAWPAHSGRSLALLSLALLVVAQVQTTLPLLRDDLPVVAALHPVNALLVFGLGIVILRRSFDLASQRSMAPSAPRPSEETAT